MKTAEQVALELHDKLSSGEGLTVADKKLAAAVGLDAEEFSDIIQECYEDEQEQ